MAVGNSMYAHLSWILSAVNGHLLIQPGSPVSLLLSSVPLDAGNTHFQSAGTAWPPRLRLPFPMEASTFRDCFCAKPV